MSKRARQALTAVLAAVFLVSLGGAAYQQVRYGSNDELVRGARELAGAPGAEAAPVPPPAADGEAPPAEEAPREDPWAEIDLAALREVNSEVAGWIAIPGTEVSYPLLRSRDNETYLTRSWDGSATSAGSIFLDCRAAWDPRGFNTIVYGHNMRNGTMFGSLRNYRRDGYWQEHPAVVLIDDEGTHYYDIFAAWEPRVTDAAFQLDFTSAEDRRAFLDTALGRSLIDTGVRPAAEGQILTLSTCTGVGHATRWVVQAVLREDES